MALTGVPGNWAGPLAAIAMHESGGDPNAQNNWDINAMMGDPSRGLFQTIGATFAAYALPGHNNILSPIDNAISAIRYIEARYGSVFNVPGIVSLSQGGPYVGYAGGTPFNPVAGTYVVGEHGAELVHLPVGASVTPHDQLSSFGDNREILALLNRIATLLEHGMSLDGQRVSSALMPYIANNIRYGTGSTGM
jgi:SLT domain-containing protein